MAHRWGNATDDPCKTWAGVICENGHVESIVLQKMRLHGTIPQFVEGDFPSLRVFSVSNNALHGTIPSSVGFLTALSQLHIVRSIFRPWLSLGVHSLCVVDPHGRSHHCDAHAAAYPVFLRAPEYAHSVITIYNPLASWRRPNNAQRWRVS